MIPPVLPGVRNDGMSDEGGREAGSTVLRFCRRGGQNSRYLMVT